MPELPEVETVARGLARHLTGAIVDTVHLHRLDIIHGLRTSMQKILPGLRIQEIRRRGKQVLIQSDKDYAIVAHLGMTGRLIVIDHDKPLITHTHLRITFKDRHHELRFIDPRRFGGIWLINTRSQDKWIGRRLPPANADPLTIPLPEFAALVKRPRQIKALLLDQTPISGIGNIYCDESLHRAGIHPLTRAIDLDTATVRRLWQALRRVLSAAIKAGGSSIDDYRDADDDLGYFQFKHRVYDRAGKPCRHCRTAIVRLLVAGRGTHICPRCQPKKSPLNKGGIGGSERRKASPLKKAKDSTKLR